jgi:hypothetical protein
MAQWIKCYACNRDLIPMDKHTVYTADDQQQFVGPDCYKRIRKAGNKGFQPKLGGPRLYAEKPMDPEKPMDHENCFESTYCEQCFKDAYYNM